LHIVSWGRKWWEKAKIFIYWNRVVTGTIGLVGKRPSHTVSCPLICCPSEPPYVDGDKMKERRAPERYMLKCKAKKLFFHKSMQKM
jgi:hypothetical protein